MNRTGLLCLFAALFFTSIVVLNCASALRVDLSSYDPYPVEPAESFVVQFRVENDDDVLIEDIILELEIDDPFILLSAKEQKIDSLDPDEIEIVEFKVYVDGSAFPGEYDFELDYKFGDEDWEDEEFEIKVREKEVFLEIVSVSSDPEKISPSKEAEVKIKVKNIASSVIKDIDIRLDLSGEIPFAPVDSITEKRINQLGPGQTEEVVIKIKALQDAELKTYKIPIQIEYSDEYGKEYIKQDLMSLVVLSSPEISIRVEKSELIEGRRSKVLIQILNIGLGEANFLSIRFFELQDYSIISSSDEYIGKIGSDDYESIELEIVPSNAGTIFLRGIMSYSGSDNEDYSEDVSLLVNVYSVDEAKRLGLVRTNTALIFILVIVVVIIALLVFRRWKRKKNASRLL